MNSRAKGQRGERELADFITAAGFPARRGQQFAGGPDSPDVVCPGLPFHIEAKRTERLNPDAAAFLAIVSRAHACDALGKSVCPPAREVGGKCPALSTYHPRPRTKRRHGAAKGQSRRIR